MMRRILGVFVLVLFVTPAVAADPPDHKERITWQEHFARANLAHDGHLTLAEAKGGYVTIARHFDEIDSSHKGYITEDDVKTWRAARRAAHRIHPTAANGQTPNEDDHTVQRPLVPARMVAEHGVTSAEDDPVKQ